MSTQDLIARLDRIAGEPDAVGFYNGVASGYAKTIANGLAHHQKMLDLYTERAEEIFEALADA